MIIFVTTSLPTLRSFDSPYLGRLFQPRMLSNIVGTVAEGMPWAADNDGFNGFKPEPYMVMLDKLKHQQGCRFVTAPDVVGDAEATLAYLNEWEGVLRAHGLPVALAGQDGLENLTVPWHRIDALFVGGTTDWKLGVEAADIVREAKVRGKWVHMGRVNTEKRLRYAMELGCDSVDGSGYGRFPKKYIPSALTVLA